ncbi:MAG: hypothetical protein BWY41_02087 [Candidatus Atribacteria bacterium ADurb.Bin276]|uniref:Uncharacterized protein n=1 Tax=Candidatus Atribacter allofermentans TaxID=1852833 RepID=A0A1V5SIZ9_9BACT|nr:MAG: hypothetical protein BWY41_02087 [Candidatus Atribacteria bacterium ADurb.Bin276]
MFLRGVEELEFPEEKIKVRRFVGICGFFIFTNFYQSAGLFPKK